MVVWIPKGEFPHWQEKFSAGWENSNILAYRTEIRSQRVTHFDNLYRYMYHFLTEEGWKFEGTKEIEPFYGETRTQDGYKEMRVWWRGKKSWAGGPGGAHPFFNWIMYMDIFATRMKRVELAYKGKKIRPFIGDVTIWFATIVEIDPADWGSHKSLGGQFYGLLKEYWIRRIYKDQIKAQEVELRRYSTRFVDDVKHFINLTRGTEARKPWFEERQFAF